MHQVLFIFINYVCKQTILSINKYHQFRLILMLLLPIHHKLLLFLIDFRNRLLNGWT